MIRILLILLFALQGAVVSGTHVVGGEMYYDRLAGNQYRITLRLYRDCGPGNVNGTGFDFQATIAAYDGNGMLFTIQSPSFVAEQTVPPEVNSPCLLVPPAICVRWAEYVTVMNLPPNATGYVISYQRCCRTPSTTNLAPGLEQGLTCTVQIPPSSSGINSSPRFGPYPPVAMCINQDMAFSHGATDPDGDELVYDLVTPFAGGTAINPSPTAVPPPYPFVLWGAGYSAASPLDGAPGLAIDPATGELTAHPTLLGSYAIAIRVREYRNGVLLGAVIRDLRLDVVACNAVAVSVVQPQPVVSLCSGLVVSPRNGVTSGTSWHWDFGVPGTDADTSRLRQPTWTYADTGTYTITLVVNPGGPCADTSETVFDIHHPLDPVFIRPAIACVDVPMPFRAGGNFTPAAEVVWDFGADAMPGGASGVDVHAAFNTPGTHPVGVTVREFGCEASYADSATVHPRPAVVALADSSGCIDEEFQFQAMADAWTPVWYKWELGDGNTMTEAQFGHTYAAAGNYDVAVTAGTITGCVDTVSLLLPHPVLVHPRPVAAFTAHPVEVSVFDPVVEVTDHAQLAEEWTYTVAGEVLHTPSFTYEFPDAGIYDIVQTVVSGTDCMASITRTVHVSDHIFYAPTAFTPDGDGENDLFLPMVKGARLYELVVFDRWGVERFRTTDPEAGWDGAGLPQGVYTYTARVAEYGPMSREYAGHFSLLR